MKNNLILKIFVISSILFFSSQLIFNSILSPLGSQLQKLNTEKEYFLEANNYINEELAKINSIIVIQKLAKEKLSFDNHSAQSTIYIQEESVIAGI